MTCAVNFSWSNLFETVNMFPSVNKHCQILLRLLLSLCLSSLSVLCVSSDQNGPMLCAANITLVSGFLFN